MTLRERIQSINLGSWKLDSTMWLRNGDSGRCEAPLYRCSCLHKMLTEF